MGATVSVMRRELGAYFNTPIGYVFIVFFLLVSCYQFADVIFIENSADMRGFFNMMPLLFIIFVPAISMRLWAEERKLGTLELLLTMPVKTWQAVVGKFLAGMLFIAVTLALTFHIPIMLKFLGNPDMGPIIGGYMGAMIMGMIYLSIGAFASSLTGDQIVAFVIATSICLIIFLMGEQATLDWIKDFSPTVARVVERFGVAYHFGSICRGVIDTRDIIYAVTMTGLFLLLNILVIERRR
jgi:ABC-2 type transport system permease protein